MKIDKYKYLGNSKYKLLIDDMEYILYEDIIINNNLLSKKNITKEELDNILKDNSFYDGYYMAISNLKRKMRSKKELFIYLEKQEIEKSYINKIVDKLEHEGYINDEVFCKSYINDAILLTDNGPLKLKKDLEKLGIEETIIDNNLLKFSKEKIKEKIKKIGDKELRLNKKYSSCEIRQKIKNKLILKGYYMEDILDYLEDITFDDAKIKDETKKKIYDKLSKKYSGQELEFKVKQKLYSKGFRD